MDGEPGLLVKVPTKPLLLLSVAGPGDPDVLSSPPSGGQGWQAKAEPGAPPEASPAAAPSRQKQYPEIILPYRYPVNKSTCLH